jgi:nicotinamide mononucleotide transporter
MVNKKVGLRIFEYIFLAIVILFILLQAHIKQDSPIAIISAICGITYTFIAGKGNPICYLFGITGSAFYCLLSFKNHLWGNLSLYALYYLPMQVIGFFRWNKNLVNGQKTIIKISLPKKELCLLLSLLTILTFFTYITLVLSHDANPILDSLTTVFSIGGMYLTVRRAIEQWLFWLGVNALSLFMWISVLLSGAKVYSTITMWAVYLILAVYFYFDWRKELNYKSI